MTSRTSLSGHRRGLALAAVLVIVAATMTVLPTSPAAAASPISPFQTFTGDVDVATAAATFRTQSNLVNACARQGSATASLSVPDGAAVDAAFLTWAGSGSPDNAVRISKDGAASTVIGSEATDTASFAAAGGLDFFQGFADISDQVDVTTGSYTVTDLAVSTGGSYCSTATVLAGWSLVVIYSTGLPEYRQISYYRGFEAARLNTRQVTLSNLDIPAGGGGDLASLSYHVWEGDDTLAGNFAAREAVRFRGVELTDDVNPSNAVHNGTVNGRSNVYGVDFDTIDISDQVADQPTSAVVEIESGPDLILLDSLVLTTRDENDLPVIADDTATVAEDASVDVDVVANDSDPEGDLDEGSVTLDSPPTNGVATVNPDGTINYTPDPDFSGSDTFTYSACDLAGACDTATVTVTVVPGDDAPVGVDDIETTPEDTSVDIDVVANDLDADGDDLVVDSVTQPDNGTVVVNPDGTVTYTPDADFNGVDSFDYQVCDPSGACDIATVQVTVDPSNDPPVGNDDSESTPEDTPITLAPAGNDSDVDGDDLVVDSVIQPDDGTVVVNPDGTVTYTPDADFNGVDSFDYVVCDPSGECDTATVTIDVEGINDIPEAVDDADVTDEDTPVDIAVLANDLDVEGDTLVVDSVTPPDNGTVDINADGTITYTPDEDFNGTDTFTYTACDPDGGCDTATVTVEVAPVNDSPVAGDDSTTTDEDTPVDIAVLDNDSDADGDDLVVDSVTQPDNGTVVVNADGTVTYTPDLDFTGSDSFTYTVCDADDCDVATVLVEVGGVNDAPVAVDDADVTDEDTPVDIAVLDNDTDADGDELVVDSVTPPDNGSVVVNADGTVTYTPDENFNGTDTFTYTTCDPAGTCDTATATVDVAPVNDAPVADDDGDVTPEDTPITIPVVDNDTDVDGDELTVDAITADAANGTVVVNGDGTVTYTPDPDFNGSDSFDYQVCDPSGLCDTATVTVDVIAVDDPPVAVDDDDATDEDTPVAIDVLGNDTDVEGDDLVVDSVTQPENGMVAINADGTVTYTPDPDFNGSDTFAYTACDVDGLCDTATVTVQVAPVNDPPVAFDDEDETQEDTAVDIVVLDNDTDPDGDALDVIEIVTDPANGTVAINADGTVTYTPDPDFNGTDSFEYSVCDPSGLCDTATVTTIEVAPVNDVPVAEDDDETTAEDTPVSIAVLGNDVDVDGDALTVDAITAPPANGTVAIEDDGTVTYTPDADFNGTDTFDYQACDPSGTCATATVTVEVTPVNDEPVAVDDDAATDEDTPVDLAVAGNDGDVDGDVVVVDSVGQPANGTVVVNANGTVTYTPDPDFNGTDTFPYNVCDPFDACDTATVTVQVGAVNDAPVAVDDADVTDEDTPVTIPVLDNDTDVDDVDLVVDGIVADPDNGSAVVNADGTVTYTPDLDFNGSDSFDYQVCDPDGACDTATVTVEVGGLNDPPVAADDGDVTPEDTSVDIPVLDNDFDVDGDDLVVDSITAAPANGAVAINADGTVTYTPDLDFNGSDSFDYQVCDPDGACDTATVAVDVIAVNDAPVAVDGDHATDEDTSIDIVVLVNDTDADGDDLVVDSVTPPDNGTVVVNADGTVTYTPDPDFNGTDTFTYTACDPDGACDTGTVTVEVAPVNDAPLAADDGDVTPEDTSVDIPVLDNDFDVDDDDLVVDSITAAPANGTVAINADGTVTYTPDPDFNGTDSFDYQVCDPDGACDIATVAVEVDSINDAPVAVDDSDATDEDTSIDIDVVANDTDADGDDLVVDSATPPDNGTVVVNADGTVTYTPDSDFNGTDTFTYTACDPSGACDTATVTVEVAPVNDAPVAADDGDVTPEDTSVDISVLDNDFDLDGDDLVVDSITAAPANGTVAINADGTVTYTPDLDFNGSDSFDYQVCDPDGACDTATVAVDVIAVNDAPVAVPGDHATDEDTPIDIVVLVNDTDADGDELVVDSVTPPDNGSVVVNADGSVTYTPDSDFNGTDTFTYTVCDPDGACDTATVTVEVAPVNDAPVAADDGDVTPEDTSVDISVLDNDSDLDGDDLVVDSITAAPANGTVAINVDGTVTYTPDLDFNGSDTFVYQACDPDGLCDTATVAVEVGGVNDVPVAQDDDGFTDEDTPVTIDLLANDSDIDGDILAVDSVTPPANGTVVVNADGTVTYTPDDDFNGTDTFTYTACDPSGACDTANVDVLVAPVNDAPVADDDGDVTPEDTPVDIPVLDNDVDVDGDALEVEDITTNPANGTVTINDDGTITYTPDAEFTGSDSFDYQVCDPSGLCATATVQVDVIAVNDAPVAVDDDDETDEDTSVTIDVLANDTDIEGDVLVVDSVTPPDNGAVVANADGTVTYTPDEDFNGTDTFTYTACDPDGVCDTATVTVDVAAVNDAPVAGDDGDVTPEDTPITLDVLANDFDVDGQELVVGSVTQPDNGTVVINPDSTVTYTPDENFNGTDTFTYTACDPEGLCSTQTAVVMIEIGGVNDVPDAADDDAGTDEDTPVTISVLDNDVDVDGDDLALDSVTPPANGSVAINADGTVTYTPDDDFNGTDTFTYTVCDPDGTCDTATVTVEVAPANDTPVAADDGDVTPEDASVAIDVLGNDFDIDDDALAVQAIVAQPLNGTVAINLDGTVTYTPDDDFNGSDSFDYQVCDPFGLCDTATVTVDVIAINDIPTAMDDNDETDEDTPVTVAVLGNDTDVEGDVLVVDSVTPPDNGAVVVNADGTVTYTPNDDFNGTDTFTYTACDPDGACDTATVTVEVAPVNDPPVAMDDTDATDEDTPVTVAVLGNDSDVDDVDLVVDSVVQPANGSVAINADGTVTYTPDDDFNGTDTFTYTVCDPAGDCDTATVTVEVAPVNDPPMVVDDAAATDEDTPVTVDVLGNDSDVEGDLLVVDSVVQPANGTVVVNADGTVTYTPDPGFNGTDSFDYQVCDPDGACDTATVTMVVGPVNDDPVAADDDDVTPEDTPVTIDVLGNDADPDGDDLVVDSVTQPANGSVEVNADGTVTYTPDAHFNGTDTFDYQVCDPFGSCDTATVTIVVTPVNDPPTLVADEVTTQQGSPVTINVLANDFDVEGDAMSIEATTDPSNGVVAINADGSLTYRPDAGFVGADTFSYTVCDSAGACETTTVEVAVTAFGVQPGPPPSPTPLPVPPDAPADLPATGLELSLLAGAAMLLLGAGILGVRTSRRRRERR